MRLISIITLLICSIAAFAQQPVTDSIKDLSRSRLNKEPIDSTIMPVKLGTDPKTGFKDLFVGKPEEEGLSQVQLNPRAISFVDDYMRKHRKGLENLKGWGRPYFDMIDAVLNYHGLPRELKCLDMSWIPNGMPLECLNIGKDIPGMPVRFANTV